jgi:hypothetical protein
MIGQGKNNRDSRTYQGPEITLLEKKYIHSNIKCLLNLQYYKCSTDVLFYYVQILSQIQWKKNWYYPTSVLSYSPNESSLKAGMVSDPPRHTCPRHSSTSLHASWNPGTANGISRLASPIGHTGVVISASLKRTFANKYKLSPSPRHLLFSRKCQPSTLLLVPMAR